MMFRHGRFNPILALVQLAGLTGLLCLCVLAIRYTFFGGCA